MFAHSAVAAPRPGLCAPAPRAPAAPGRWAQDLIRRRKRARGKFGIPPISSIFAPGLRVSGTAGAGGEVGGQPSRGRVWNMRRPPWPPGSPPGDSKTGMISTAGPSARRSAPPPHKDGEVERDQGRVVPQAAREELALDLAQGAPPRPALAQPEGDPPSTQRSRTRSTGLPSSTASRRTSVRRRRPRPAARRR